MKYAGADWVKYHRPNISEFGSKVADILGQAYKGIYHAQKTVLNKRTEWESDRWIEVVVYGELSTYDGDELTRLVLLCHEQSIRLGVCGAAPGYLRLTFSPRKNDPKAPLWDRHPSIEQAIAVHNKHFSLSAIALETVGGDR